MFASILLASAWTLISHTFGPIDAVAVAANFGDRFGDRPDFQDRFGGRTDFRDRFDGFTTASVTPAQAAKPAVQAAAPMIRQATRELLDPGYSLGAPAGAFRPRVLARLEPDAEPPETPSAEALANPEPPTIRQLVQSIPLPAPRPQDIKPSDLRVAQQPAPPAGRNDYGHDALVQRARTVLASSGKPGTFSLFEKLFGGGPPPAKGPMLAFAGSDGGVLSDGSDAPAAQADATDRATAVYDISAKMVYMPDGSKLEAHSGLGAQLDDPRFVHVKMRGPTPPHIYDLKMRESLFHGVAAVRLTPVGGESAIYGRTGLLAHTYMLGPNGDSNGCISFRNYDAFLRAFRNGEVKRVIVVAKL